MIGDLQLIPRYHLKEYVRGAGLSENAIPRALQNGHISYFRKDNTSHRMVYIPLIEVERVWGINPEAIEQSKIKKASELSKGFVFYPINNKNKIESNSSEIESQSEIPVVNPHNGVQPRDYVNKVFEEEGIHLKYIGPTDAEYILEKILKEKGIPYLRAIEELKNLKLETRNIAGNKYSAYKRRDVFRIAVKYLTNGSNSENISGEDVKFLSIAMRYIPNNIRKTHSLEALLAIKEVINCEHEEFSGSLYLKNGVLYIKKGFEKKIQKFLRRDKKRLAEHLDGILSEGMGNAPVL